MYPCVTGGVSLFLCSTSCAVGGAVMERGEESLRKGLIKTHSPQLSCWECAETSQLLHHYLILLLAHICWISSVRTPNPAAGPSAGTRWSRNTGGEYVFVHSPHSWRLKEVWKRSPSSWLLMKSLAGLEISCWPSHRHLNLPNAASPGLLTGFQPQFLCCCYRQLVLWPFLRSLMRSGQKSFSFL